ncbi:MAG: hypothetical protein V8Q36_01245 [Anaerotignum sp.]
MSAFYDNNVTDVGRLLLGDVQMGARFVPTKIVIGKGYLPQGKTTRTMTDVADVVKELVLNKATKNPDGDAIFGAIFSNADIQGAFYYRELGLYAKGVYYNQSGGVERETAEVLYSYGNAGENAELIPAYSTGSVVERQLDLLVYIGNDTEVKLEIETGLYVTIPVFNDTVERLEKDIEEVRYIVDSTTAKKYEWAMESGTLSLDEVDGDTKINIADKETLDAVKGKVDLIHINTEGLSGKIGQTNDSGGSEAAGSVFAKLNKIIGDIAAHVKQWTAERAAKLDQLDTINENAQTASTKATELVEDVAELKAAVAQETTVEDISNKIGTEEDADTQPTLFGRLAQLKKVLVEKLAEVLTKVTGIDGKIGTIGDADTQPTLFGRLAQLKKVLVEKLAEVLTKVTGIDGKIGTIGDADTQPTLFGRLAQLKKVLLEKLAELLTKVTGIDGKIGTSEDEAESSTLFGYILSIYKGMGKKCVISKNKQFDVDFLVSYNNSATLLVLNRVSDYDGSILIELTDDFGPSDSTKFLWAFSESSLMVSSSDYTSTLKIKELISLPERFAII